ncbi:MAG TPA: hypothetical protein VFS25_00915 [Chitinophaga sp.]|uniref:hypothetical protein n=1 Tax=Chitinophaga sp. TaxID=1869181 RepID=UPI002DB5DBB8|nr:hypothetical protein [Chitinophaga sp.]HEU4551356.1 hypothetical protein [Chitinophaga sp.]
MAKQTGPVYYTGTRGDTCFYEMEGEYYMRRKSSLSSKRVKRDPAFALTRIYAGLLAQASPIASAVYRKIPRDKRRHAQYREMRGAAQRMLKQGITAEAISAQLEQKYLHVHNVEITPAVTGTKQPIQPAAVNILHKAANTAAAQPLKPVTKVTRIRDIRKLTAYPGKRRMHVRLPRQAAVHLAPDGHMLINISRKKRLNTAPPLQCPA